MVLLLKKTVGEILFMCPPCRLCASIDAEAGNIPFLKKKYVSTVLRFSSSDINKASFGWKRILTQPSRLSRLEDIPLIRVEDLTIWQICKGATWHLAGCVNCTSLFATLYGILYSC
jgi:hypothetical protein